MQIHNRVVRVPTDSVSVAFLASVLVLLLGSGLGGQAKAASDEVFGGPVRLSVPPVIYATVGVETNIYFDNIVLVINPANYVFDVICEQGFHYDERWTYTPEAGEAGEYPITIEVLDLTNTVIARAKSMVKVASAEAGEGRKYSYLAIGDSHLERGVYVKHMLELSKADEHFQLVLVGCRGEKNQPASGDVRHEGYGGWTAQAFATIAKSKRRTGYHKRPETGSPFIYQNEAGENVLDLARYCQEFNNGQPLDFVTIQLGGNDIWRSSEADIDESIDKVLGYYDMLIKMIRDASEHTKIGIVLLDPPSRSQHGFRNYRQSRRKTRWQYRRIQHRMVEREIEKYGDRETEGIYLVPVNLSLDCLNAHPTRELPLNARMPEKQTRVNDGVHLSTEGYQQFGDTLYAWLKASAD